MIENVFGGLDDIDREAAREGVAIRKLGKRKRERKCGCTAKGKPEKELDLLRILNITYRPSTMK